MIYNMNIMDLIKEIENLKKQIKVFEKKIKLAPPKVRLELKIWTKQKKLQLKRMESTSKNI